MDTLLSFRSKQKTIELASQLQKIKASPGGHMSNDNLILFPKKSTSSITMSESEAKWMVAGSLLVVLTVAIGINSALFSQNMGSQQMVAGAQTSVDSNRSIASVDPIFRVSWEKKAFEVLDKTQAAIFSSFFKFEVSKMTFTG